MSDTPAPVPPPAAAPAKSGNRTLIIILCVIVGFFLLIGGCVATCTYLVSKKAREISREAKKNPVYASLSLAASLNPDVQVLSKDEDSGKITVRNKKTGETVTINSNDFTSENIGQALEKMNQRYKTAAAAIPAVAEPTPAGASSTPAESETKPAAAAEPTISAGKATALAAMLKEFPEYVPAYPGATTIEASRNNLGGIHSGTYVFLTADKPDAALDFYEKKATAAGFTVMGRNGNTNDYGPTATMSLLHNDPQGTITINAESKADGKTQVSVNTTEMGK